MKKTFDIAVWDFVKENRHKLLVVDSYHAYAIIKDKVDSLWEQIRLLSSEESWDELVLLDKLATLAAYVQIVAEGLSLVPEQMEQDESDNIAEEEAENAKNTLRDFLLYLKLNKHEIRATQKGIKRFSIEFDEHTASDWENQLRELE